MKILHVHTRYREQGGEDSVVDQERRLLADSGFDVVPVDFDNPTKGLESIATLATSSWNKPASDHVLRLAQAKSVDVVHVHNTWFALSPAVVSKLARADFPVVMTFHNYRLVCVNAMLFRDGSPCELCVGRSPLAGIRYRCYRDSVGASAMVALTIQTHRWKETWADHLSVGLALTEFARARLLEGGLPADRVQVKPNFVPDPGPRDAPPSSSGEVLFVGRMSQEKGVRPLVDAWNRAGLDDLELTLVGDGPEAEAVERRAGPAARFVGRLSPDEIRTRMLGARALVVPSLAYEGMPMVILEALAAGLPVFHTERGALAETAGAGGIALGSGVVAAMSERLAALADGPAIDRIGELGRIEYESRFSEARSIEKLEEVYSLAIGAPV